MKFNDEVMLADILSQLNTNAKMFLSQFAAVSSMNNQISSNVPKLYTDVSKLSTTVSETNSKIDKLQVQIDSNVSQTTEHQVRVR